MKEERDDALDIQTWPVRVSFIAAFAYTSYRLTVLPSYRLTEHFRTSALLQTH